jgi:hypothetical protein
MTNISLPEVASADAPRSMNLLQRMKANRFNFATPALILLLMAVPRLPSAFS